MAPLFQRQRLRRRDQLVAVECFFTQNYRNVHTSSLYLPTSASDFQNIPNYLSISMNVNIHTTFLVSWWDATEGSTQSNKSAYGVGGDGMEVTVEEKRGMTIE
jgi:hypothetical protein